MAERSLACFDLGIFDCNDILKEFYYLKFLNDQNLNQKEVTINKLNDDCLLEVFKYLSIKERLNAATTCNRWAYICELSWRDVTILNINEELLKQFCQVNRKNRSKFSIIVVNILKNCGPYLKSVGLKEDLGNYGYYWSLFNIAKYCTNILNFTLYDLGYKKCITDELLEPVFINNPKICSLSLNCLSLTGNCLTKLQPHIIEELKIINCKFKNYKYLYDFVSQLKNLKKIYINDPNRTEIIQALIKSNCNSLSEFFLPKSMSISYSLLSNLLSKQEKLEKLQFYIDYHEKSNFPIFQFEHLKELTCQIKEFSDDFMFKLKECINLKELKITQYVSELNHLSEIGVNYFGQLKNLEFLDLQYCKNMDNLFLATAGKFEKLKVLKMKYCKFTEQGFKNLCSILNLTHLDVSYSNVTCQSLIEIVKNLLKLKELNIYGCIFHKHYYDSYILNKILNEFIEAASVIKSNRKDENSLKIICSDEKEEYGVKAVFVPE